MIETTGQVAPEEPTVRDWIAIGSVMLGAFMAVIDILITNASLKEIQSALGATIVEGSWISTAYLVAEIIIIPMTAWLTQLLGIRRLAIWMSFGFIISSLLCSAAWSLESMVIFRAMQGFSGGAFIPLCFTMVLIKLPEHRQPIGMALFAVIATFAPTIGPAIGGWLTENVGWKYLFYINVPPCLLMISGLLISMDKSPIDWAELKKGDYAGILFIAVGLGTLEVMLEEGYRHEWFESTYIRTLGIISAITLTAFIIVQLTYKFPLVNLKLLTNRNFALSCLAMVGLSIGLYGSIYAIPLYLSQIQQYNAQQIGEMIMWMGLPQLLLIPFVPLLMRIIDPRLLCVIGICMFSYASFITGTLNPDVAGDQLLHMQIIRALGQPLILITAASIATCYIRPEDAGSASSLFNIVRNLSGAVFISLLMTQLQQDTSRYYDYLREAINLMNPIVQQRLDMLSMHLGSEGKALALLAQQVKQQASILAYNEAFHIMGVSLLISIVAVLLTRRLPKNHSLMDLQKRREQ